ncbi:hypothetical protein PP175_23835 [Aneurinibacillus sp. Ricciae_BoGa-3]|uniref:hypothetical protein n=1 Tax=Aneurinibacillus sp. Ricciae_BoGa-3 TaxID=3022697 RepID=UPI0023414C6D|nr:hypothetical protein [Aneurinibacillus sp. Ricciae_BoGa-3]WCK54283.1 hypothetical protein PP175_23835 [Aneurinibacillus sp. Ricciae_BoGa-3]
MGKEWTGERRNLVVYALLGIAIVLIVITIVVSQNQNQQFSQDSQDHQTAQNLLKQNKFGEAEKLYKSLLDTHPDSYLLQWEYSLSLYMQGKYKEADDNYGRVRELRPAIIQDARYLIQYAEVLKREGKVDKATAYAVQAKKINNDPALNNEIAQFFKKKS